MTIILKIISGSLMLICFCFFVVGVYLRHPEIFLPAANGFAGGLAAMAFADIGAVFRGSK